jgi:hypothetical protein
MNKRIKELFTLAFPPSLNDSNLVQLSAEKFAELIVEECIDEIKQLRKKYDTHEDVEPEENDWYVDAFLQAEVRLKEHFGVEE